MISEGHDLKDAFSFAFGRLIGCPKRFTVTDGDDAGDKATKYFEPERKSGNTSSSGNRGNVVSTEIVRSDSGNCEV